MEKNLLHEISMKFLTISLSFQVLSSTSNMFLNSFWHFTDRMMVNFSIQRSFSLWLCKRKLETLKCQSKSSISRLITLDLRFLLYTTEAKGSRIIEKSLLWGKTGLMTQSSISELLEQSFQAAPNSSQHLCCSPRLTFYLRGKQSCYNKLAAPRYFQTSVGPRVLKT